MTCSRPGCCWSATPRPLTAVLLLIVVRASARSCYFPFCVIENWLAPGYRSLGLLSAMAWLWRHERR